MLLTSTTTVRWNSRNKKRFVDLGYVFTKMGDPFDVSVEDLSPGSSAIVNVMCDFCGAIMSKPYERYITYRKITPIDSCNNPKCEYCKAKMSVELVYGTYNVRTIDYLEDKRKKTILEKYGVENPFANEEVKQKIRETNMQKYGVPSSMQNKEVQEKAKQTCLEKYGVDSYIHFLHDNKGEKSPCWKGGKVITPRNRQDYNYKVWRTSVFERDDYTCQKCGKRSGNGEAVMLIGHHILNWVDHEDMRYDVNNGITLCENCHHLFHKNYGFRNNTEEQIEKFLCKDEKIC